MRAARRLRVPYVSRPLGQLGRWPLRQSAWRKRLYLALGEACHLRAASALHFTSEAERAEAAALGFHGEIIPHGIDLPRLVPRAAQRLRARFAIPPENKIVLFLGRLHPKKGLDLLLPAFAKLAAPAATLILAGDGDVAYLAELRQLSHQLNLTEKIRWVGFVNGEEKALLLQGSDLFVLPSRHENFGLAVLEALAAGTPVLISDQVALTSEIAHSHVGEVISLDPIALTGALARLLALPPQRDYNRAFVAEHYSWQRTAATLTELYASLCPGLLSPA